MCNLIRWLHQKPAGMDILCFQKKMNLDSPGLKSGLESDKYPTIRTVVPPFGYTKGRAIIEYLHVIFVEWNADNNSCIRRISSGIGLQCFRESHIRPNMVLYKKVHLIFINVTDWFKSLMEAQHYI